MKKTNITFILSMIIAACLFSLTACHKTSDAKMQTLYIGTFSQAIDYAPYYIAKHFDWFEDELKKEGVVATIEYKAFDNFEGIKAALADKHLHAFFAAEAPIAKLRSDKDPIKIVELTCAMQLEIVVRPDSGIVKIADLNNKKIAVAFGTGSHYGLLKTLTAANLTEKNVAITFGFPDTAKIAFETNEVAAWAVWPPFVQEQIFFNRGKTLAGSETKIHSVMALHTDTLDNHPEIGRAIRATLMKAKEWMIENPAEAQSIVAKELFLQSDVVKLSWPKHSWGVAFNDNAINDIEDIVRFLVRVGTIDKNSITDIDEFVRTDLIKPVSQLK